MSRTVASIESDIFRLKQANPDWARSNQDKALLTELIREKNNLSDISGGVF